MSDYVLKIVAGIFILLWLLLVLPSWILGMLYAGEVILLPPADLGVAERATFVIGMYLPPALAGIAVYRIVKAKKQKQNA